MRPDHPSRRALLTGRPASRAVRTDATAVHVSSAIVTVLPDLRDDVARRLSALAGVEIHHIESFKIVVVLEAEEAGAIGGRLAEIATWSGVLSANMVFEQTARLYDGGEAT
ncbi:chaperone NapD [Bradyrhizobium sp. ma5]|uniref:chaperone NapD n=1 Tax=Bradyrhizobium sp. ma5 TaxID=3344828 RepID=UPI0035D4C59B